MEQRAAVIGPLDLCRDLGWEQRWDGLALTVRKRGEIGVHPKLSSDARWCGDIRIEP